MCTIDSFFRSFLPHFFAENDRNSKFHYLLYLSFPPGGEGHPGSPSEVPWGSLELPKSSPGAPSCFAGITGGSLLKITNVVYFIIVCILPFSPGGRDPGGPSQVPGTPWGSPRAPLGLSRALQGSRGFSAENNKCSIFQYIVHLPFSSGGGG